MQELRDEVWKMEIESVPCGIPLAGEKLAQEEALCMDLPSRTAVLACERNSKGG